ncbi:ABC transporter substrate-binding protein [Pseudonocardia humida]|nr:ABC transporter substrate-binding protein [Pseudonocardia humida]
MRHGFVSLLSDSGAPLEHISMSSWPAPVRAGCRAGAVPPFGSGVSPSDRPSGPHTGFVDAARRAAGGVTVSRRFRTLSATALVPLAVLLLIAGCGRPGGLVPVPAGEFTPVAPGTLTVATIAVPTPGFWEDPAATPGGGFEEELAQRLAARFGLDTVRVVEVPLERLAAGDLGGADIALAQLTPTARRAEVLDFSVPYLSARPTALVRSGTGIPDVHTARGLRWAVTAGSTLLAALQEQIRPAAPAIATSGQDASVDMLRAGAVDAVLLDLPVAMVLAARSGGTLASAAQLPGDDSIAAAVPRSSPNAAALDTAIRRFTTDGTLAELADRWLGDDYPEAVADVPLLRTGA